jgi:hypothetical protein
VRASASNKLTSCPVLPLCTLQHMMETRRTRVYKGRILLVVAPAATTGPSSGVQSKADIGTCFGAILSVSSLSVHCSLEATQLQTFES